MTTPTYMMTDQEIQLEQEEEKYGIYTSTFGYEGDNSNLDSKMDSDSNAMAYLYLEQDHASNNNFKVLPSVKVINFPFFKLNNFKMDNLINYWNVILIYMLDSLFYRSVHIYILKRVLFL